MNKNWTARKAEENDFESISEFRKKFSRLNISCYSSEYYYWKFVENPIQCGELWIAESENTIVGIKSVTPKRIMISGNYMIAGEIGDSYTSQEFRGSGIFTILSETSREKAIQQGVDFVYNTPNKNSRSLYEKKLDHAEIHSLSVRNLTRPLNYKLTLQGKYGKGILSEYAAIVINMIFAILDRFVANNGKNDKIKVEKVSSFPEDISNLWIKESCNYDIAIVRDFNYLEWRFVKSVDKYIILIARNDKHEIQGYLVGKIDECEADIRLGVGVIVDFFISQENPKIFSILLTRIFEEFRRMRVYKISTWSIHKSLYYKALIKFGFIPHNKTPVLCYKSEMGSKIINGNHKWHFTIGDSDNA